MADLEDYQFQAPGPHRIGHDSDRIVLPRIGLIVIAIAILGIAAYLFLGGRTAKPAATVQERTAAPKSETLPVAEGEHINLPALDDSDALVRQRIGALSSNPLVSAWLGTTGLIRNFVVVVDNIAHGITPSR